MLVSMTEYSYFGRSFLHLQLFSDRKSPSLRPDKEPTNPSSQRTGVDGCVGVNRVSENVRVSRMEARRRIVARRGGVRVSVSGTWNRPSRLILEIC